MVDSKSEDRLPSFEDPFTGDDVEQRIYAMILQTREPTTVSALAERADCDPKTARKYLNWFTDLGIVSCHDGRPATYERNEAYFEWRRVNTLAADHSTEELQQRVRELTRTIADYEEAYTAESPAEVDTVAVVETDDSRSIDDVYGDLANWTTARQERRRYERARQQRAVSEQEQAFQ